MLVETFCRFIIHCWVLTVWKKKIHLIKPPLLRKRELRLREIK